MSKLVKKVFFDNSAKTSAEAIEFLSDKAVELGIADDRDAILAAFNEREAQGPTGMTGGFALPHAKSEVIKEAAIIVVKFGGDIEWKSMDNSAIKAAIAIFVPGGEAGTTHLVILSKVAALLMQGDFCEFVLESDDEAEITAAIEEGVAE